MAIKMPASGSGSGCWGRAYGGVTGPPGIKARKLGECGSTSAEHKCVGTPLPVQGNTRGGVQTMGLAQAGQGEAEAA